MPRADPAVTEPGTITVHVPIAFRRRGGRKTLTLADGSPVAFAPARPRVHSPVVKATARAFRWRKLIETGVYPSMGEIAAAERINPSYVGRILRLTLLAPDIVEGLLDGRQRQGITMGALIRPFSVDWDAQRLSLPR